MSVPPINRLDWSATNGTNIEQVLLISGVPILFAQANSVITSASATVWSDPTQPDPAWWPSVLGNTLAVKNWLKPSDLEIGFRARPVDGTVECQPVTRTLYDTGEPGTTIYTNGNFGSPSPSALFAAKRVLKRSPLTASVGLTDTTINVLSTTPFGAVGQVRFIYLGLETFKVVVANATTFIILQRGMFGSIPQNHTGSTASGQLTAKVWSGLPNFLNRRATLWAVGVTQSGSMVNPTLLFDGIVGAGSGADGATWKIRINSILNSEVPKPVAPVLQISGYSHTEYSGLLGGARPPQFSRTPLAAMWTTERSTTDCLTILTNDPTYAFNREGYHPDLSSFIEDWNAAGVVAQAGTGQVCRARTVYVPGQGYTVQVGASGSIPSHMEIYKGWGDHHMLAIGEGVDGPAYTNPFYDLGVFPTAYQSLGVGDIAFFTLSDLAQVPLTAGDYTNPYLTSGPPSQPPRSDNTEVWCSLFVPIGDSTGAYRIVSFDNVSFSAYGKVGFIPLGVPNENAVVLEPTAATLGFVTASDTWWSAIWGVMSYMGGLSGFYADPDQFDWSRVAQVAQQASTPFSAGRMYPVDIAEKSYLDLFKNEVRLNGMVVSPYYGRVSCTRISGTGSTTDANAVIYKTDLRALDMCQDSENPDGLLSTFTVKYPDGQQTVTFNDLISMQESGKGGSIEVDYYGDIAPATRSLANPRAPGFALAFANLGQHAIGPWCSTYRVVTVPLTPKFANLQIGDTVRFGDSGGTQGDWILPNGLGGRGLAGVVGTVIGTKLSLFKDDKGGTFDIDVRVSTPGVANYAPEVLVSAITGTALTVDISTWGANGFAPQTAGPLGTGLGDGGASQFKVGDVCQLLNTNTAGPVTPFDCTVTSVTGTTIKVTPAPGAGWVTAAATPYAVTLSFVGDYDSATNTHQHDWLWTADHTTQEVGVSSPIPAYTWAP